MREVKLDKSAAGLQRTRAIVQFERASSGARTAKVAGADADASGARDEADAQI